MRISLCMHVWVWHVPRPPPQKGGLEGSVTKLFSFLAGEVWFQQAAVKTTAPHWTQDWRLLELGQRRPHREVTNEDHLVPDHHHTFLHRSCLYCSHNKMWPWPHQVPPTSTTKSLSFFFFLNLHTSKNRRIFPVSLLPFCQPTPVLPTHVSPTPVLPALDQKVAFNVS